MTPSGPVPVALSAALPAPFASISGRAGALAIYHDGEAAGGATPLLLLHSVNGSASAAEVRPLFLHSRTRRPTYALDLPGYGHSERSARPYTIRLMTDAVHEALHFAAARHGGAAVDVMALSLSCEFAAEAVLQQPGRVRTLTLISPTGMEDRRVGERHEAGKTREAAWLRRLLRQTRAGRGLYRLLTTEPSVRWFLARSWGTRDFDPRLLEHGLRCATLPGAENAPLDFVAGALFTAGVIERYRALPVPLWVAHGKQGAFTDFGACPERCGTAATGGTYPVERTVFESGAMPHFQLPDDFNAAYERFISGQRLPAPQARRPRDGRPASMVGRLGVEPSTNGL